MENTKKLISRTDADIAAIAVPTVMTDAPATPIEQALEVDKDGYTTTRKLYKWLDLDVRNYSRWVKVNLTDNPFAEVESLAASLVEAGYTYDGVKAVLDTYGKRTSLSARDARQTVVLINWSKKLQKCQIFDFQSEIK